MTLRRREFLTLAVSARLEHAIDRFEGGIIQRDHARRRHCLNRFRTLRRPC